MAKLNGILKLEGTIDNITFYKSQDGHLAKSKTHIPKDRIMNDPNFARTRENGAEFGSAAQAGKLLRNAVRNLMQNASDNRVTSRVTQVMTLLKNYDTTSTRGSRKVSVGLSNATAKAKLKGFDFNINSALASTLFKPYAVTNATGKIDITGLVPNIDLAFPTGSTHVSFKGAWAKIDFANNITDIQFSNVVNLIIDGTSTNVSLTPTAAPTGTGTNLFFLAIDFFQQVNGVQYPMKNGAFNSLAIVQVS